jgi:hypothetical protein
MICEAGQSAVALRQKDNMGVFNVYTVCVMMSTLQLYGANAL